MRALGYQPTSAPSVPGPLQRHSLSRTALPQRPRALRHSRRCWQRFATELKATTKSVYSRFCPLHRTKQSDHQRAGGHQTQPLPPALFPREATSSRLHLVQVCSAVTFSERPSTPCPLPDQPCPLPALYFLPYNLLNYNLQDQLPTCAAHQQTTDYQVIVQTQISTGTEADQCYRGQATLPEVLLGLLSHLQKLEVDAQAPGSGATPKSRTDTQADGKASRHARFQLSVSVGK